MSMISEQVTRLRKLANQWKHNDVAGCNLIFEAADTIEALYAKVRNADRPTGKWIKSNLLPNGWNCDNCGSPIMTDDIAEMLYCPNCGSEMGGESDG